MITPLIQILKNEFIFISSIPKLSETEETCCIHIQGESIYWSSYTKSLGFYIDRHLDWEDHISHIIKKAFAGITVLRETPRCFPLEALQTIYRSLVECRIRYGDAVCIGLLWRGSINKTSKSSDQQRGAYCDRI